MNSTIASLLVTVAAVFLAIHLAFRRRFVLAGVCLVCFFALLRPGVVSAGELCSPTRYADGDTFTFLRDSEKVRVRVAGFDAPERGQPFSQVAMRKLRELTEGGADCDCYKKDRYGRSVCTVRTRAGENVAAVMVGAGLGCIDPRFEGEASSTDRQAAREALQAAQAARVGMWSQAAPLCAYDYRKAQQ